MIETVDHLSKLLQDWYASLPNRFKIPANPTSQAATSAVRLEHLLYLHNCFYGGIMAIHAVFTYPWMMRLIDSQKSPALREQELLSTSAMAEAARCIILATRSIEINGRRPHWRVTDHCVMRTCHILICRPQVTIYLSNVRLDQFVHMHIEKHKIRFGIVRPIFIGYGGRALRTHGACDFSRSIVSFW